MLKTTLNYVYDGRTIFVLLFVNSSAVLSSNTKIHCISLPFGFCGEMYYTCMLNFAIRDNDACR